MAYRLRYLQVMVGCLFAMLTGAFAIRAAMVAAYSETNPGFAGSFWSNHPEVLTSQAMIEVAQAAGRGQSVSPETFARLGDLADRSPLAPEPYLIKAAVELRDRNYSAAETLLLASRERAPRSAAARYLLSDLYWRQGRPRPALRELAALRRLMPSLTATLTPALAQYARAPGGTTLLRQILAEDPQLEDLVLTELASDHRNTGLILSLARGRLGSDAARAWQSRLLTSLVRADEYALAYGLWRRFAPPSETSASLTTFQKSSFPSPFAWTLAHGAGGAANPLPNRLEVHFTEHQNVTLAARLVLLPAGTYEMSMSIAGKPRASGSILWSVACLPERKVVASVPLTRPGRVAARFQISPECNAQSLELAGIAQTYPEAAAFAISNFQLRRLPL